MGVGALAFVALVWAMACLRGSSPRWALVFGVALALRLLLLPLEPTLSNDAHRYLWDGRVLAAGYDPYSLPPEAEELVSLRGELWERMHHRDVPTVYPPMAMALFTVAARLPGDWLAQLVALKGLLVLVDLLACAGLVYIARRRDLSTAAVVAYAWNPLVCLEIAGMGHVDALGVACVVLGVAAWHWMAWYRREPPEGYGAQGALDRWRVSASGALGLAVAMVAGVLSKLVPVVLLPLWARACRRPLWFVGGALAALVVGLGPLWVIVGGVPPGLLRYGVSWEFNGPLFEPLWRLFDLVGTPQWGERLLNAIKAADGHDPFWNRFYPFNYPQLHAKLVLAGLLGCAVLRAAWQASRAGWRDPVTGTGRLLAAALLCTATFYPWYSLWVLPFAALCGQRAWLALSALMLITYAPQHGEFSHWPWTFALVWIPFALLLWRNPRWELREPEELRESGGRDGI
ncbi:MAG: hypothetical protein AAGD01_01170 [Acidobacteriota bacterium]